ncbi:hypothetical protein K437DRAFT_160878 [Tilletiaria anomala UBC 951]|uniref:Uncharacterized protein n=1 Tax=Tilletiaria anomala (strain ATCC 24038 / CBS 436.72 / UBC 951) TaxID=1037660 RepID=A0A066VVD5_TILAU|nr:uncharacterized protein K437DRAFT_160878 [Tilletiaria anomala UBC 951]KDN42515.1 hypothetical protein K437DRAFT_160878 [Tilletiaria anomala UBC 951]
MLQSTSDGTLLRPHHPIKHGHSSQGDAPAPVLAQQQQHKPKTEGADGALVGLRWKGLIPRGKVRCAVFEVQLERDLGALRAEEQAQAETDRKTQAEAQEQELAKLKEVSFASLSGPESDVQLGQPQSVAAQLPENSSLYGDHGLQQDQVDANAPDNPAVGSTAMNDHGAPDWAHAAPAHAPEDRSAEAVAYGDDPSTSKKEKKKKKKSPGETQLMERKDAEKSRKQKGEAAKESLTPLQRLQRCERLLRHAKQDFTDALAIHANETALFEFESLRAVETRSSEPL